MFEQKEFLTIKEASYWASQHIGKAVTPSNIADLINFGNDQERSPLASVQRQIHPALLGIFSTITPTISKRNLFQIGY